MSFILSFFALVLHIFVILLMLRNNKLRRKPANNFFLKPSHIRRNCLHVIYVLCWIRVRDMG